MAWPFSTKKIVHVATQVVRVVEDELVSDIPRTAPITAIIRDDDISETIVDAVLSGIGFKVDRAVRYARRTTPSLDGLAPYTLGLPNHTFMSDSEGLNEMRDVLEDTIHPSTGPIEFVYHHFTELHLVHLGFQLLTSNAIYGYDRSTNEVTGLSTVKGFTVYLENIVGVINTHQGPIDFEVGDVEPASAKYQDPYADALNLWEVAPNARYTPWVNPETDMPNWEFSDAVPGAQPDTVHAYVAWRTDVPEPGSPTALNIAAYEAALAQAVIDAADAQTAADAPEATLVEIELALRLNLALEMGIAVPLAVTFVDDYIIEREVFDLGSDNRTMEQGQFHTAYYYDLDATGGKKFAYFTYGYGDGTYPALDGVAERSDNASEFAPFVMFRSAGQNLAAPELQAGDDYKTAVRLMNKLNMDYQDFSDSIHENPDAGKIEQAVLVFGIPINAQKPLELRYLSAFFYWVFLNDKTPGTVDGGIALETQILGLHAADNSILTSRSKNRSVTIEDRDFRFQLNYSGIATNLVAGVLQVPQVAEEDLDFINYTVVQSYLPAVIGDVTSEIVTEQISYNVWKELGGIRTRVSITRDEHIYIFREQVSLNTYRELRVAGFSLLYRIDGQDVVINSADDQGRLLIPINYDLVRANFTSIERDRLYGLSIHTVYNSRIIQKVKWYESTAFKGILIVAAVAITIVSYGAAADKAAAAYAAYAAQYGAVVGALILAFEYIVIQLVVTEVFRFVAETAGAEVALVLAIVAYAVGVYGAANDATWAPNLLKDATGLANAANSQYAMDTADYNQELQKFELMAEAKWAELEELRKATETLPPIDPLEISGLVPRIREGELADTYFERTVHNGNVGALSFDYVHNYADVSLRLPSIEDTMQAFNSTLLQES